ncbi:hypothetical protein AVEN_95824-1 [Araneus ventricosus]|uniref:Uncharacterized protein n=1 Tax=Araneus ventricosus TaxID=182803 RepID=A0A4Y2MQ59_ARAVE|nr:hypothetical protein AVEN_95824-1 [Araneus ventricosus]
MLGRHWSKVSLLPSSAQGTCSRGENEQPSLAPRGERPRGSDPIQIRRIRKKIKKITAVSLMEEFRDCTKRFGYRHLAFERFVYDSVNYSRQKFTRFKFCECEFS